MKMYRPGSVFKIDSFHVILASNNTGSAYMICIDGRFSGRFWSGREHKIVDGWVNGDFVELDLNRSGMFVGRVCSVTPGDSGFDDFVKDSITSVPTKKYQGMVEKD